MKGFEFTRSLFDWFEQTYSAPLVNHPSPVLVFDRIWAVIRSNRYNLVFITKCINAIIKLVFTWVAVQEKTWNRIDDPVSGAMIVKNMLLHICCNDEVIIKMNVEMCYDIVQNIIQSDHIPKTVVIARDLVIGLQTIGSQQSTVVVNKLLEGIVRHLFAISLDKEKDIWEAILSLLSHFKSRDDMVSISFLQVSTKLITF